MGSAGFQEQVGDEGEFDTGHDAGAARPDAGLKAAELELLRSLPDYDAEEMATVRPPAGWQQVTEAAASTAVRDSAAWAPPNRVEAPSEAAAWAAPNRVEAPSEPTPWSGANRIELPTTARPWADTSPTEAAGQRTPFPEERTMALLAEDLLGRPLSEPEPGPEDTLGKLGQRDDLATAAAWTSSVGSRGSDLWDQAMPLVMEG